jgi:hypothetical protein
MPLRVAIIDSATQKMGSAREGNPQNYYYTLPWESAVDDILPGKFWPLPLTPGRCALRQASIFRSGMGGEKWRPNEF